MTRKKTTPTELPPLAGAPTDVDTKKKKSTGSKNAIEDAPRFNGFLLEPERVVIVGIDTPHKSRAEHPLWDKRIRLPVNVQLAEAMMLYGFTTVIEVRKNGRSPEGEEVLEVVDGRQRTRAARLANERLVAAGRTPLRIRAAYSRGEDTTLFGHRISANEHRTDDPVMDKARNYQQLLDMGQTEREAQVTFGIDAATGRMWGRLLELDPIVQQGVDAGAITPSAAAELADLSREDQRQQFGDLLAAGGKITQARIQRTLSGNTSSPQAGPKRTVLRKMVGLLEKDSEQDDSKFDCPREDLHLLKWVAGELPDEIAMKAIPWLAAAIQAVAKKGSTPDAAAASSA